jgi:hypothetical protein
VGAVIARMWTGLVPTAKSSRYKSLMLEVALPHYRSVEGNEGAWCLTRDLSNGLTEFKMLTMWQSIAAIKAFAGENYQTAVYYDFDDEFLVEKPELVDHFGID